MTSDDFRTALSELGFTQRAFARRLDVHYNSVSAWAKGNSPVPGYVAEYIRVLRLVRAIWMQEHPWPTRS